MKNHNPSGKNLRIASTGQRLFALSIFAVIACLIWLAVTGQYDTEVNRFAAWLREHYDNLRN